MAHPVALRLAFLAFGHAHVSTGGWGDASAALERRLVLQREQSVGLTMGSARLLHVPQLEPTERGSAAEVRHRTRSRRMFQ
jgi:hypothetical protein